MYTRHVCTCQSHPRYRFLRRVPPWGSTQRRRDTTTFPDPKDHNKKTMPRQRLPPLCCNRVLLKQARVHSCYYDNSSKVNPSRPALLFPPNSDDEDTTLQPQAVLYRAYAVVGTVGEMFWADEGAASYKAGKEPYSIRAFLELEFCRANAYVEELSSTVLTVLTGVLYAVCSINVMISGSICRVPILHAAAFLWLISCL